MMPKLYMLSIQCYKKDVFDTQLINFTVIVKLFYIVDVLSLGP